MRRLLLATVFLSPATLASAATSPATCRALQRIDAASINGFRDIPTHPMKGVPGGMPDAVIPGGSQPMLMRGMGTKAHLMTFSVGVDSKSASGVATNYKAAKRAVMGCLPGTRFLGENSPGLTPVASYTTANGMTIEISQDFGGSAVELFLVDYEFTTSSKPVTGSEIQKPECLSHNILHHWNHL